MELKLLIIGDSFSASDSLESWVNLLGHDVTNISSCGSSEYRIVKKLLDSRLDKFDHVVLVHTSPYRIYVEYNPLHRDSETHQQCDLIYQDVEDRKNNNEFANHVCWWFENIVDLPQSELIHRLLIKHSFEYLESTPSTHVTFFSGCEIPLVQDLSQIYLNNPGSINHMNSIGNQLVADLLDDIL